MLQSLLHLKTRGRPRGGHVLCPGGHVLWLGGHVLWPGGHVLCLVVTCFALVVSGALLQQDHLAKRLRSGAHSEQAERRHRSRCASLPSLGVAWGVAWVVVCFIA